uniref:Uncharacterized protein n=1 Tax=viral metagenome TaxID=1070528 RepID=A0A6M3K3J6_9ZZZZ
MQPEEIGKLLEAAQGIVNGVGDTKPPDVKENYTHLVEGYIKLFEGHTLKEVLLHLPLLLFVIADKVSKAGYNPITEGLITKLLIQAAQGAESVSLMITMAELQQGR